MVLCGQNLQKCPAGRQNAMKLLGYGEGEHTDQKIEAVLGKGQMGCCGAQPDAGFVSPGGQAYRVLCRNALPNGA